MAEQQPTDLDQLHEELTAYLDGELDSQSVRRIEERLARDEVYRAELQRLERTWNLLDKLPRATVDEGFARSTIEMVALAASQEADAIHEALPRRINRMRLAGLGGIVAAGLLGFVLAQSLWPSPNEGLLRDLPVLENFDRYYQADNLEFLKALDREGLFAEGDDHAGENAPTAMAPLWTQWTSIGLATMISLIASRSADGADDMAQRRLQVARMTPTEQQELLRKQEQFLALPPEQQNRFRALQSAIDADPHADRLRTVLKEYHEWLKTLSPGERAELAELEPEQRVERIKHIKARQQAARVQAQRAEVLTSRDMRAILRWTEDFLWQHRERVLNEVSSSWRKKFEKEDEQKQRRALLLVASFSARRGGSHAMTLVKKEDIDALSSKLSEAAQQELNTATELAEQRKIVGGWIGVSMHRLEPWQGRRKLPPPVEDELAQFFEQDLRPQQRERLLKMPNDQMREELRRMYFERERWDPSFSGRGPISPEGRPFDKQRGPRSRPPRASNGVGPTEKPAEPAADASDKPDR